MKYGSSLIMDATQEQPLLVVDRSFQDFHFFLTEVLVAFPNIFMGKVESQILNQSAQKPLTWKRYTDDIFSI